MPTTILPDWLARAAANFPDRLALARGSDRWTFAELDRRVTLLASQLAADEIRPGDHVALLAGNDLPYVACVHALTRLGAVLVPLNLRLTADELAWQVRDAEVSLLLSDAAHAAHAAEVTTSLPAVPHAILQADAAQPPPRPAGRGGRWVRTSLRDEIDLDAAQAVMYTSGTTGRPKGAILTYGMQWWNATASALNLGLLPDDRWLVCLPLYHVGGLTTLIKSVIYGMPIILHDRFDPAAVNAAIRDERVTIISVVAVMLRRMLDALDAAGGDGRYPPWLRCVLLGGGPAPRPLLEDCARRGIPVVQTYGMTESCSQAVTLAPHDALRKLGSAGRPLAPVQLRIFADDGTPAAPGVPGEIYLRGPTTTPGYHNRPDETAAVFHDGWFATGDLGYLDTDGYLYVLDRRADLIISGGENVYPAEIEAALLAHPDVAEAGVCGVADPAWDQIPIAFVHLHLTATAPSITPADLLDFLRPRLARYKLPRAVYLAGPLPRTAAGKLLRRDLPALLPPDTTI
jgi:o-succinylbenzoate---CoA ligase